MAKLVWDEVGKHFYETGTDHGIFFPMIDDGSYGKGEAWNGLTSVTESPSGADSNKQYADNIAYLDLQSAEEFGATIEAFGYPKGFAECNGEKAIADGVTAGQQARKHFGFYYRTRVGNDVVGDSLGYKHHLIYNCAAAPSERSYQTVNDSPEAVTMSWEITTTPTEVGEGFRPTACITIDSTQVDADKLATFLAMIEGGESADAKLPTPAEVYAMFNSAG